jgi:hypothetical protein
VTLFLASFQSFAIAKTLNRQLSEATECQSQRK